MIIEEFVVTMFEQNARLIGCEKTGRAICIDPGANAPGIASALEERKLTLQAICLTHAHMDHIGGVTELKKLRPAAEIILHAADEPLYTNVPEQLLWLGIPRSTWPFLGFSYETPPKVDRYWQDGEIYEVGTLAFKIIHTPGHTPGHVVLFEMNERKVFVGDCLFAGSIGRTDLPGGNAAQLMDSLVNKILPLGDDVAVYTGHGPTTVIGRERQTNPFLTNSYTMENLGSRL